MPAKKTKSTTTTCTDNGNCARRAHEAGSDGRRSWVVTKRRSRAELIVGEKTEATAAEEGVRVCADCQASSTPLWRSGPYGPLSLCNACGIRYRKRKRRDGQEGKARKMVSTSGNGASKSMEVVLSEEELRRRQREKQEKILTVLLGRRGAGDWRRRWLPARSAEGGDREEVAEAALLLLSLSSAISAHV